MTSIAGIWVPESDDAASRWGIRLAAIKLGLRERGAEHTPEIGSQTLSQLDEKGISHGWSRSHEIETCTPPVRNAAQFGKEATWEKLQGELFDAYQSASGPVIFRHIPGTGKTTNVAIGAADRNIKHLILFSTHEKAREHILDDVTPDDYIHLKGAEQPRHDCCLDAKIEADEDEDVCCPEHGKEENWPRMCPLQELDEDSERRQQFEAYSAVTSHGEAHGRFCADECPWAAQFENLEEADRVVGVHEYQQLLDKKGFTVIIDETPRISGDDETLTVADLRRMGSLLTSLGTEHAKELGEFVRTDLLDAVVDGSLDGLTPPEIDVWDIAEELATLKIQYNEKIQMQLELDAWDGAPPHFEVIIAILAEIGFSDESCREAIAAPSTLDYCPHCQAKTRFEGERRQCNSCYWEEGRFSILPYDNREQDKAIAYLEADEDPSVSENQLCFTSLPDSSDLPDSPLILDATAIPEKVAGFYGVSLDEVTIYGKQALELNAHIRQILDGAYHQGTIEGAFEDKRRQLDKRLQDAIDAIAKQHEKPLFITTRDLLDKFDFPEHAETRYYWGLRGLNMQECDAVVCIGGPHPRLDGLERKARLLAMDHPDLEVGGEEHSTRRGAPNPPIYRKLYYEDEDGQGRAVPTKYYTGLVGELFLELREKELEQAVHRIRPLFGGVLKDIYLLTNVPTTLPVDEFLELEDFSTEPLGSHLPVKEDAVTHLLEPLGELMTDNTHSEIDEVEVTNTSISATIAGLHRISQRSGADWSESTVRRRVKDLQNIGLITREEYEQNQGNRYTIEKAALSRVLLVASSTCEKAELVSRFRQKTNEADGSSDWLEWAYDEFVTE